MAKLKHIPHKDKTVQKNLTMPKSLVEEITLYVAFLEDVSDSQLAFADVASQILKEFIESDKEFLKWKNKKEKEEKNSKEKAKNQAKLDEESYKTDSQDVEGFGDNDPETERQDVTRF